VHEIVDYHTDESFPNMMDVLSSFRFGVKSYRERRWDDAINAFRQALIFNPQDFASEMYLKRCEYFKQTPPPIDWNGVWVLKTK
jgi:adenylate cyclase